MPPPNVKNLLLGFVVTCTLSSTFAQAKDLKSVRDDKISHAFQVGDIQAIQLNPKELLSIMKRKQNLYRKGSFETTEQFENRISTSDALKPLKRDVLYAIKFDGIRHTKDGSGAAYYDPDSTSYKFDSYNTIRTNYIYNKLYDTNSDTDGDYIRLGIYKTESSNYAGISGIGVRRNVDRSRFEVVALRVPENSLDKKGPFTDSYIGSMHISAAVPVEQAKAFGPASGFEVYILGWFKNSLVQHVDELIENPTIANPFDTRHSRRTLPFKPHSIIVRHLKTGQIIYNELL